MKSKRILWERDKGRCFYCSKALHWDCKTIDHVIPRSKGGSDKSWNLVICCYECNAEKGNNDPTEEQLRLVRHRKFLQEARTNIGRMIENLKAENRRREAQRLIGIQRRITEAYRMNPLPVELVENLKSTVPKSLSA